MLTVGIFSTFNISKFENNYQYSQPKLCENYNNSHNYDTNLFSTPQINNFVKPKTFSISFLGHTVHIVDAGNHADYMKHFATAVNRDIDLEMHYSIENENYEGVKQLKSLESELHKLNNSKESFKDEYIAVPALASVPILNITDQYQKVMGKKIKLTPENIKAHKKELLAFLKEIYENPDKHRKYIDAMDSAKQEIEYSYGVIQEINELKRKGAKVYIPSGHPHENTLKWAAKRDGVNTELYHYIATGKDTNNVITNLQKDIKEKIWYDFNLLSLSEANVVGVKSSGGIQDYMFAAYDSCITDGARGVYNLSPVRTDNGKIVGYSFTDTKTVEYPLADFPKKDRVANISPFVGKSLKDVLATSKELSALQRCILYGYSTDKCADKLYPVNQVIKADRIRKEKIELEGEYTDKSRKMFFSVNKNGEVIFPRCDCEGSGKPSVFSMWGSCFAVFNAIARDIHSENGVLAKDYDGHIKELKSIVNKSKFEEQSGNTDKAFQLLDSAIHADSAFHNLNPNYKKDYTPFYLSGNILFKQGKYDLASAYYNNAINLLADYIVNKEEMTLDKIRINNEMYEASLNAKNEYNKKMEKYNKKSFIGKLFASEPEKPWNYDTYKDTNIKKGHYLYINHISNLVEMYQNLAIICKAKGENYPAKICEKATTCIKDHTDTGELILQRRADGVQYLGDLFEDEN